MRERTPLILFGDGPRLTSGLARIARDLAMRIVAEQEDLGVRFVQVGVDYPSGYHWQPWDFYGFQPNPKDQGRGAMSTVVDDLRKEQPDVAPIIFGIVDPARFFDITRTQDDGEEIAEIDTERLWLYAPLDATTPTDVLGGPAGAAICDCERLLGYGRWGADLLKRTAAEWALHTPVERKAPVQWLPHGIETRVFNPAAAQQDVAPHFYRWYVNTAPAQTLIVGCVATNQPRKDFGLLFATVAELQAQGMPVALWLHTDKLTHAWDIGELTHQFALRKEQVYVSSGELTDQELATRYAWSDVTIAPGLGEGFGYPIVESLACGTPVVHVNYAGGAELVPNPDWLVDPCAWRLESIYTLLRPVVSPKDLAAAVLRATAQMGSVETVAYCTGAVAHLDWQYLWPRWRAWITKGLRWDPQSASTPSTSGAGATV